ncbi:flavin-containing monooxygenase [Mycolicibacterium iranicum]|uniref:Pyridine nucleotide-disulfide oxidoreductase n=1 Tax=Mycolicibacterium iranicum TaxID=912594 RepID=A0A178LQU6_MYCIR|nr:NAD(P)/FAD-dependent oxidoreductase [Mycolicibacterium iranicum]OAN36109.1 pyridine nucleotide-disulfide oxidoreductase [Mycolicibacterium iranicum]
MTTNEQVVVVGAGPCGLAIAQRLRHDRGVDALVVDRADAPASTWRTRYDGFRLNTCGFWSHLPGQRIPVRYGRWPGRDQMVDYFDDYARRQELRIRFGCSVIRIDREGGDWVLHTEDTPIRCAAVVIATGNYHTPTYPAWPGMDTFTGELLHSAHYRNGRPFRGRDVLVIGAGNSATDIALQLSDGVASRVRMAVRTPPHLVPRSAAGIPVDAFSPAFGMLPVPVLDGAAAVMRRLWFGDLSEAGLPAPSRGIYTALLEDDQIPTLGDELVPRVRAGRIGVVAAVCAFDANRVVLADGSEIAPDVVIAATGYEHGLEPLVGHLGVLDEQGKPTANGLPAAAPGLWFAGFDEPLIGPLQSFRLDSGPIAGDIAGWLASVTA